MQLASLEVLFGIYDADGSGKLSVDEFGEVLKATGSEPDEGLIQRVRKPNPNPTLRIGFGFAHSLNVSLLLTFSPIAATILSQTQT